MSSEPQSSAGSPVPSPCTDVCRMDEASGWCEGCARTLRGSFLNRPSVYDQREQLRACDIPTLLMFGDDDTPSVAPTLFMRAQMPCCSPSRSR